MRKMIFVLMAMMLALPVWGATFPVTDDHTLVSSDTNGFVTVKVTGEVEGWFLVQFCQDNLRAGCGNKIAIQPISVNQNSMTFQLDMGGVRDGQVAFNFRRKCDNKWLAIPDCRVKTGSNTAMGMSFYTKDIDESGGAHFVYTGSGMSPWSPIDANKWCDERAVVRTSVPPARYADPAPVVMRKRVIRKVPCANGKGICSQPCIIEIKNGVEKLVASVGEPTPDEPVGEKTLQQKARLTLDSVGKPDATDHPEEKTLQQKARKNLQETKEVHKKIGTSKRKGATVQGTLDVIHQDIKDIKAHLKVKEGQSCVSCHSDMTPQQQAAPTPSAVAPQNNLRSPTAVQKGKTYLDGTARGSGK